MPLPKNVDAVHGTLVIDKSGADPRKQHRFNNTQGVSVAVGIKWAQSTDFMVEGVAHVEDSSGNITDAFISASTDDPELTRCNLTIPAGGALFIAGQRPEVYSSSSFAYTEEDFNEVGTPDGTNFHPFNTVLTASATGLVQSQPFVPIDDYTPSAVEDPLPCTPWRAELIGHTAWLLDNQSDATGGLTNGVHGSTWDDSRGWGYAMGNSWVMTLVHLLRCAENPFYGAIGARCKSMMFWELSRALKHGGLAKWDGNYTGGLGLANAQQIPWLAIVTFYDTLTAVEKDRVLNMLRVIGHANAVMPVESTANQSFHYIENLASFIKAWKHIRSGESDENLYDDLLVEMVRAMTERPGYTMGQAGKGLAFVENYGYSFSYGGLQRASLVGAIHVLEDDTDLADVRSDLIDLFNEQELFFEPFCLVDAQGVVRYANGYDARQTGPVRQYGGQHSMIGISPYPGRTVSIDYTPTVPVTQSHTIYRNEIATWANYEDTDPVSPISPKAIPSTLRGNGSFSNGWTQWERTSNYFAGFCTKTTWSIESISRVNNSFSGDLDGGRLGESGEFGGPFSASVENSGSAYTAEISGSSSGVVSGQGALEALSFNGVATLASRNISPLTVHGLFASDGTRYYTADPHSQDSTWDAVAKTLTTTFSLYLISGTFTRVLDFSDPARVTVSITAPADPGGGPYTLKEVVPRLTVEGTPQIKQIDGFSSWGTLTFGTEDNQPNIERIEREVAWGETLSYSIEEQSMSGTDLITDLAVHFDFNESAADSAPSSTDFEDAMGTHHLTDGGDCSYAQGVHGNTGESFLKGSTATHPPKSVWASGKWNIPVASDFTVGFWMYLPQNWSQYERLFSLCNDAQSRGLVAKMHRSSGVNDKIYFRLNTNNQLAGPGSTLDLVPQQFNHIVFAHEHGVGTKLYINGSLSDTITYTSQVLAPADGDGALTLLGQHNSGGSTIQDGGMAQFSVWDRLLDDAAVAAHYNSGTGLSLASYTPVTELPLPLTLPFSQMGGFRPFQVSSSLATGVSLSVSN